jgi:hypothetical protein
MPEHAAHCWRRLPWMHFLCRDVDLGLCPPAATEGAFTMMLLLLRLYLLLLLLYVFCFIHAHFCRSRPLVLGTYLALAEKQALAGVSNANIPAVIAWRGTRAVYPEAHTHQHHQHNKSSTGECTPGDAAATLCAYSAAADHTSLATLALHWWRALDTRFPILLPVIKTTHGQLNLYNLPLPPRDSGSHDASTPAGIHQESSSGDSSFSALLSVSVVPSSSFPPTWS